ncbi:CvpA family protein [Flavobacteriales bacterium]|nr:CvpA family protein [Flavobacteriales bacterium]
MCKYIRTDGTIAQIANYLCSVNYIDIAIAVPLLWGAYKGFTKGLIIELASIIGLILGGYIGMHFSGVTSSYLEQIISVEDTFMPILSFALTFLIVVLAVYLLAKILEKVVNLVALKLVNKISGSAFGLLKAGFIVSLVLVLVESIDSKLEIIPLDIKEESLLYTPLTNVAPTIIPAIKEIDLLDKALEKTTAVEIPEISL